MTQRHLQKHAEEKTGHAVIAVGFTLLALLIIGRLFYLQVVRHEYYLAAAAKTHETSVEVRPVRGSIYFSDAVTGENFPAAINKTYYLVFAVPKNISIKDAVSTTDRVAGILGFNVEQKAETLKKINERESSYRVLAKKVPEEIAKKLKAANIPGIQMDEEIYRFYPENELAAPLLGFTVRSDNGDLSGKYGIEGFLNKKLAGRPGYILGEKGAGGGWITLADRTNIKAEDGPDIFLTIDRALQQYACDRLRDGLKEYEAKSAALVLMDPESGAVYAMCSLPDFDPNNYSQVKDLAAFNNTAIFTPYEPGSVFKTFTMGAGLDLGLVTPNTTYTDPCELTINGHKVRNAEQKCYGKQTMTEVLEKSINTGVVWVEQRVGRDRFHEYVKKFGFGDKTGITLSTEMAGDVSSLDKKGDIFGANGSFGQGLTATPLQVAVAYSVVANGGKLMKPFIIAEERLENGRKNKFSPQQSDTVISEGAARLLSGMLVSVVENHYRTAQIPEYYVAGKTGTAQIPEKGKYSEDRTNQTFAGFAPATRPKFVLVVKYEEPNRKWAEQTALPVFKDVMKFALDYLGVPGDKQ